MRPSVIFCSFLLLLTSCRKDQLHFTKVEKIETFTTTDRLNKIFFVNDSVGYVIGGERFNKSTLLKTTDGGKTFSYRNFPEAPKELFGISQSPKATLYLIGFDGKLLKSDNGTDWEFHQLWYLPYKDIAFVNDQRGFAVGGVSFNMGYTTNITKEGSYERYDSTGYEMNDIEMISGATGYICSHGVVMKTEDSAKTWHFLNVKNDNFTAIHAYGAQEAWTCGYNGSVFHTSDGGNTWEQKRNGNDLKIANYNLLDILFTDAKNGYAIGENGTFIYTDDGGEHWIEFEKFTNDALRSIAGLKNGELLVCGDKGGLYRVHPQLFQ